MAEAVTQNGTVEHGLVTTRLRDRSFKGQATALDARAERLVQHVRSEVEGLRESLDLIGAGQEEMLEVTPASVAENPSVAATLAPMVLVRSLISAGRRERDLEEQLAEVTAHMTAIQHEVATMREDHAGQGGRMETLDQVIEALHENLRDLRAERKNWIGSGPSVPALPPAGEAD